MYSTNNYLFHLILILSIMLISSCANITKMQYKALHDYCYEKESKNDCLRYSNSSGCEWSDIEEVCYNPNYYSAEIICSNELACNYSKEERCEYPRDCFDCNGDYICGEYFATTLSSFTSNLNSIKLEFSSKYHKYFNDETFISDVKKIQELQQILKNKEDVLRKNTFIGNGPFKGYYDQYDCLKCRSCYESCLKYRRRIFGNNSALSDKDWEPINNKIQSLIEQGIHPWTAKTIEVAKIYKNFFEDAEIKTWEGDGIRLYFWPTWDEIKNFYGYEKLIQMGITKDNLNNEMGLFIGSKDISFSHDFGEDNIEYHLSMNFSSDSAKEFWSEKYNIHCKYEFREEKQTVFSGQAQLIFPDFINKPHDKWTDRSFYNEIYLELIPNQELINKINSVVHMLAEEDGDRGAWKGIINNTFKQKTIFDITELTDDWQYDEGHSLLYESISHNYKFYWEEVYRLLINKYSFIEFDDDRYLIEIKFNE